MHGEIGHNGGPTSGNWIAISREMRNHPIVGMGQPVKPAEPSRGSYSKYEAWQDLLMEAKWKPFEIRNKGKMVTLAELGERLGYKHKQCSSAGGALVYAVTCLIAHYMRGRGLSSENYGDLAR